jgi:hypothetical protein
MSCLGTGMDLPPCISTDSASHLITICSVLTSLGDFTRSLSLLNPPHALAEMLKSSLRHVARSPSTHPTQPRTSLSTPIRASFSSRSHQRRQSSSKPPIPPNDGARNMPASSVKTVGTPRAKEAATDQSPVSEQASTDVRIPKRKVARQKSNNGQHGSNQWTKNMPSVPSTQHLSIDGISPETNSSWSIINCQTYRCRLIIILFSAPTHVRD